MCMNSKFKKTFFVAVCVGLFSASMAGAQPYYYFAQYSLEENNTDIVRVNLEDGNSQVFLEDVGSVLQVGVDPTGSWLYLYPSYGPVEVVSTTNPGERHELPDSGNVVRVWAAMYAEHLNRFYVSWTDSSGVDKAAAFDGATFRRLFEINAGMDFGPYSALSADESAIYELQKDTSSGVSYLEHFSISSNTIVGRLPFSSVGPPTKFKTIERSAGGKFLVSFEKAGSLSDLEYFEYDPSSNLSYPYIYFPWRSEALLSSDAKYIILRQTALASSSEAGIDEEIRSGTLYVFEASTGKLTQRLSLPPNGKILVVSGYPQTFFYFDDSTNQAIAISDTVVTPTSALIDTLISLKHQAVAKGWLRENRDRGHDIDEMMRGNEWYKEGEFKKFRSWEVGKDWDFDHDWNNGIVEVLDKRLDMAKRALSHGDSVMTRRNLEIFVMEVELLNNLSAKLVKRGEEPIITSDGYLSLKFNAEYLIDRLPERHSEGSGGGRRDKR